MLAARSLLGLSGFPLALLLRLAGLDRKHLLAKSSARTHRCTDKLEGGPAKCSKQSHLASLFFGSARSALSKSAAIHSLRMRSMCSCLQIPDTAPDSLLSSLRALARQYDALTRALSVWNITLSWVVRHTLLCNTAMKGSRAVVFSLSEPSQTPSSTLRCHDPAYRFSWNKA